MYAGARPLAQATPDGGVRYLHAGVRGDVRAVTDVAGSVTDSFSYTADGEVTTRTGTTPVSVGWNGEYSDPDTGMVWLRARWYDPASARFISADPWHGNPSVPVSLNRYLYANADPVNNVDPTGLFTSSEQAATMTTQPTLFSIRGMSVSRANFIIQAVLDATIAISAATVVAVQTFGADDPNDQDGIDGDGDTPDADVGEGVDQTPGTQTGGAGSNGGSNPPTVTTTTFCSDGTRIEPEDWNGHIYPRHVSTSDPKWAGKSKFDAAEDVQKLICDFLGTTPVAVGTAKNGLIARTYEVGRPIGTSGGSTASAFTVFTRANGSVVTAHPGWPSGGIVGVGY